MFKFIDDLNGLGKTALSIVVAISVFVIVFFAYPILSQLSKKSAVLTSLSGNDLNGHSIRASILYSEAQTRNVIEHGHKKNRKFKYGGVEIASNNNYYFCALTNFYNYQSKYDAPNSLEKDLKTLNGLLDKPKKGPSRALVNAKILLDIGNVHLLLGEVKQDPTILNDAKPVLDRAVEAIKLADVKFTPVRTQGSSSAEDKLSHTAVAIYNTIGHVNHQIAVMTGSKTKFKAAAKYYRKATKGQNSNFIYSNLGCAQSELANLTNDAGLMRTASKQFEKSLSKTSNNSPAWGKIKNDIGSTLQQLGRLKNDRRRMRNGIKVMLDAIDRADIDDEFLQLARMQHNLGNATYLLGNVSENGILLKKSIEAYEQAIDDFPRAELPIYWAASQNNLGLALSKLGSINNDNETMERSVEAIQYALEERTYERMPLSWVISSNGLAQAYVDWAKVNQQKGNLNDAKEHVGKALKILGTTQLIVNKEYAKSFALFYSNILAEIKTIQG